MHILPLYAALLVLLFVVLSIDHAYFRAVHGADDAKRRAYLDRAYQLGRAF